MPVKRKGADNRGENATQHTSEREPYVILGQVTPIRSCLSQCGVTQEAADEQQDKVDGNENNIDRKDDRNLNAHRGTKQDKNGQRQLRHASRRHTDPAAECEDESHKINGEWQSPDHGHRREIDGNVRCYRQHQSRWHECRQEPIHDESGDPDEERVAAKGCTVIAGVLENAADSIATRNMRITYPPSQYPL